MPPPLLKELELVKKKDRKSLTYDFKHEVIKRIESGVHRSVVCKELGLADSTIRYIMKSSDKIKDQLSENKTCSQKMYYAKVRIFLEMDKLLFQFIEQAKKEHGRVTEKMICVEARRLFSILKHSYKGPKVFYATQTWYQSFMRRVKEKNITLSNLTSNEETSGMLSSDEEDMEADPSDDYVNEDNICEDIDENTIGEEQCQVYHTHIPTNLEEIHEDNPKLTPKIIEDAINYIDTGFELLEKHDNDWERVSTVRRKINDAITSYKAMLIASREKTKQNAIYDILKSTTSEPDKNERVVENTS